MLEPEPTTLPSPPSLEAPSRRDPLPTWSAAAQVALLSGVPTQFLLLTVLVRLGMAVPENGEISFRFFAILSLADTLAMLCLMRWFLAMSGERPRDVFLGRLPVRGEALRGVLAMPLVLLLIGGVVLGLRRLAPWTHTVEQNPFEAFMQTPLQAAAFAVIVAVAGGVREEFQRAFILHRFEQRLGGMRLGLVLFSVLFGALHYPQGLDAAIALGLVGLLWGVIYMKRRSVVGPVVNHAAFNVVEVLQVIAVRALAR